jgi:hypothetical protein
LVLIFQEKIFIWQPIKIETRNRLTRRKGTIAGMRGLPANQETVMILCIGHTKGTMKKKGVRPITASKSVNSAIGAKAEQVGRLKVNKSAN